MKKIKFLVEVEIEADSVMSHELFGQPAFICPEHQHSEQEIKECFLETLIWLAEHFGCGNPDTMHEGAKDIKAEVLNAISISEE